MNQPKVSRLFYMDNLRAILMLLGILVHTFIFFTPHGLYPWPVRSLHTSNLFSYLVLNIHIFRMPLFFLIAGFFAAMLKTRLGWLGFWRHRGMRIGVPFLICMFLLSLYHFGEFISFYILYKKDITLEVLYIYFGATMALWFLYYLLLLYFSMFVLVSLWQKLLSDVLKFKIEKITTNLISTWYFPLILSVPSILIFLVQQYYYLHPPLSIIPRIDALLYYLWFFMIGWILFLAFIKNNIQLWSKSWLYFFVAFFLLFPLYFYGFEHRETAFYPWQLLTMALYPLTAWCLSLGLLSLVQHGLNKSSKILRYLADASYWFYLAQMPILLSLQFYFRFNEKGIIMDLIGIVGITLVLLTLSYTVFVRHTKIGVLLNGKR